MATDEDVPKAVINLHNSMVLKLSKEVNERCFKDLKYMLLNNPLSRKDIEAIQDIQDLFSRLMDKTSISYGNYRFLLPILQKINPSLCKIVEHFKKIGEKYNQDCTDAQRSGRRTQSDKTTVTMHRKVYHTKEGTAAFLKCTVKPTADNIEWKRAKKHPPPSTKIHIDNVKFFSGHPEAPTLVIAETEKAADEDYYQCAANDNAVKGDVVELKVSCDETNMNRATVMKNDTPHSGQSIVPEQKRTKPINESDENNKEREWRLHSKSSPRPGGSNMDGTISRKRRRTNRTPSPVPENQMIRKNKESDKSDSGSDRQLRFKSSSSARTSVTDKGNIAFVKKSTRTNSGQSAVPDQERTKPEKETEENKTGRERKLRSKSSPRTGGSNTDGANMSISRKSRRSKSCPESYVKHRRKQAVSDQGCEISVLVNNDRDTTPNNILKAFKPAFKKATGDSRRMKNLRAKQQCLLVCMDIIAAESPMEPSSVHLAEQFKLYLSNGGTIQTSDKSHTVLDIDEDSFKIKPKNADHNGPPFVSISYGEFRVPVGEAAIIKTNVIASPPATVIEWFRIEKDMEFKIEIDNEKYFGSSDLSPTLIIRRTNIDDQGHYMCQATNRNGVGSSNIAFLSTKSGTGHNLGTIATEEVMTSNSRDLPDAVITTNKKLFETNDISSDEGFEELPEFKKRKIFKDLKHFL